MISLLLLNLILSLVWAAITGTFSPGSLAVGFVFGYAALWPVRHRFDPRSFNRPYLLAALGGLFLRELVRSGIRVAVDVLRPELKFKPGIVAIHLEKMSEIEIMILANLISLTPGTLSVDVSKDRSTLYVHAMNIEDPDELRQEIKNGFERRVREALGHG
ncbi:MAG: Na+/H+ antiporter subunit E [Myxococcota bacterium]